jgi:hypothetical protein
MRPASPARPLLPRRRETRSQWVSINAGWYRPEQFDAAFAALGKRLVVSVETAA